MSVLWVPRFGLGHEGPAARARVLGLVSAPQLGVSAPKAELGPCLCLCLRLGGSRPRVRCCPGIAGPGTAGPGSRPGSEGAGPGRPQDEPRGAGGARPALGRNERSCPVPVLSLCWGG